MLVIKIASNIFLASANICFPLPPSFIQQDICYVKVCLQRNWKQLFSTLITLGFLKKGCSGKGDNLTQPSYFIKGNVKKSKKSVKIDNIEGESLHILCTISSYLLIFIKSRWEEKIWVPVDQNEGPKML